MTFILVYLQLFLAVLLTPGLPRRCVYVFTAYAFLLAESLVVFIFTLILEPAAGTSAWEIIYVTGQKNIAAASLLTGLLQIRFAQPLLQEHVQDVTEL